MDGGGDPAPWHSPEGSDRKVTSPYAYFEAGQLYLTRERGRDEGDTHHLNFRRTWCGGSCLPARPASRRTGGVEGSRSLPSLPGSPHGCCC